MRILLKDKSFTNELWDQSTNQHPYKGRKKNASFPTNFVLQSNHNTQMSLSVYAQLPTNELKLMPKRITQNWLKEPQP